jgi:protein-tyrosine phosphatase
MNTMQPGQRHLPLEGTYNIRDIGGYPTTSGDTTRWRTFLRADSLHRLTPVAQQELIDYGLRTVIDLRFDHECSSAPNVFAASDEVTYVNISLLADAAPNAERRMLPDLESIYKYILDERQAVLKQVFDVMTAEAFPVLIHCTAGKDRTGIISALMLGLAGVDHATIAADYALTAHYAGAMFDELRAQAATAGRDMSTYERYLESKPEAMRNTLAYLEETYESVPAYLARIGLSEAQVAQLRQKMRNEER